MQIDQLRASATEPADETNAAPGPEMTTRNRPLFAERLDRRRLLKVAGGLLLMSVVDVHFNGRAAVAATRMNPMDVLRTE